VIVWANTVGPYANRQETYAYFQLPYCQGTKQHEHYHETLGEALMGMELVNAGHDIKFREPVQRQSLCSIEATNKQLRLFEYAISYQYYFQMFVDDLPIGGTVSVSC
jgi:transmembrane 9 superfamily member 3